MNANYKDRASTTPLHVAYVVYRFDMGGLERCVANLCNNLNRERFRPMIVCLERGGSAAAWLERDDVPILELGKKPRNEFRVIRRLAKALREHQIDVVHSHNWGTLVETTLARRWAGVPFHVHSERGTVLGDLKLRGWRLWLRALSMRWALNRTDRVLTNATSIVCRMSQMCGFPAERVSVIPNGVERPQVGEPHRARNEVRRQLAIPADAFVAGSVGRLVPVKGFATAVDAVSILKAGDPDVAVHLILVGDGPERDALSQRASEQGIADRVHLVGRRTDIGRWMAAMDVYINTSLSEGMSQSLVEAMATGLPIIATDVGESASLVNGDRPWGIIASPANSSAFAEAIAELRCHPRRRVAFGKNAIARHANHYSLQRMIADCEWLYSKLLAPQSPHERCIHPVPDAEPTGTASNASSAF